MQRSTGDGEFLLQLRGSHVRADSSAFTYCVDENKEMND